MIEKLKTITRNINDTITCNITSVIPENDLTTTVYAINWFDTKVTWMYHLYNILAKKSLKKIEGKLFFKGKVIKTIEGTLDNTRELLLIVEYPSPEKFLDLLSIKYFQLVSVLRILAVSRFSFGFTSCVEKNQHLKNGKRYYYVHHFKTTDGQRYIIEMNTILRERKIGIIYSGVISSLLSSQKKEEKSDHIACLMDGIILIKTKSHDDLVELLEDTKFLSQKTQLDSSYIGQIECIQ